MRSPPQALLAHAASGGKRRASRSAPTSLHTPAAFAMIGATGSGAFEMSAFPPPVQAEGGTCYISDYTDIGIGMIAATEHPEEARAFLGWVGSPEFVNLYGNALPGFFPLSDAEVTLEDPLAQEFISWRDECESTIRSTFTILSRGTPNLENETWNASANVLRGTETPPDAAARLQEGPGSRYTPAAT